MGRDIERDSPKRVKSCLSPFYLYKPAYYFYFLPLFIIIIIIFNFPPKDLFAFFGFMYLVIYIYILCFFFKKKKERKENSLSILTRASRTMKVLSGLSRQTTNVIISSSSILRKTKPVLSLHYYNDYCYF